MSDFDGLGRLFVEPVKLIVKSAKLGYQVGKSTGKVGKEIVKGVAEGVKIIGRTIIK